MGVVVGEGGRPSLNLRHAIAYLDPAPYLRPEEILFLEEAARYLFAPWARSWRTSSPFPPLRHRVRLYPGADPKVLPPGLGALVDWREEPGALTPSFWTSCGRRGCWRRSSPSGRRGGCWCP